MICWEGLRVPVLGPGKQEGRRRGRRRGRGGALVFRLSTPREGNTALVVPHDHVSSASPSTSLERTTITCELGCRIHFTRTSEPTDRPTNGIPKLPYPCPPGGTLTLPAFFRLSAQWHCSITPEKAHTAPSGLLEEVRNLM
ncbi:hypothetical protein KC356_g36 [Hortaea werneckii]|nr:hypothetical protein KC356_g36 [Hortaea werneckii]